MTHSPGIGIDSAGYFQHGNRRIVPVGVNYYPSSCGMNFWRQWPEREMQHDLDVAAALGLNCFRFFLLWEDFEPQPGCYDQTMLDRLRQFLQWCRQRSIYAHPSLFTAWMSGGIFWPAWREQRNLYADPFMCDRSAAYAKKVVEVIHPFKEDVLAIDLGNEMDVLEDSQTARPSEVVQWCRTVTDSIRQVWPDCLIVSGNSNSQVMDDKGWRLGMQPGTDFYSMHAYPMPNWNMIGFDGMTDPLCQSLLPFYTKAARAYGPVMVQEYGPLAQFGAEQQDAYLRAVLDGCWKAGANGFLAWGFREIYAQSFPHQKQEWENTLGLLDGNDRVKPGMEYILEFARAVSQTPAPDSSNAALGLYWPEHYYLYENQDNPGNKPEQLSGWLAAANYLLEQLGYRPQFVVSEALLDTSVETLVIAGALLTQHEITVIAQWVQDGGQLIWHGPGWMTWGHQCARLLGAGVVDYRSPLEIRSEVFNDLWVFSSFPQEVRVEVKPETAKIIANDEKGLPVVLKNGYGKGSVTYALALPEAAIVAVSANREARDRWMKWYAGMLALSKEGT